jgi:hypothetical protein
MVLLTDCLLPWQLLSVKALKGDLVARARAWFILALLLRCGFSLFSDSGAQLSSIKVFVKIGQHFTVNKIFCRLFFIY